MSLKNFLLDLLFPKKCYGCGRFDIWLCQKCLANLKLYEGEIPRALNNTQDLVIAGEYKDKVLSDLIIAFKFGLNQELAIPLFIFLKSALDKKILIDNLSGKLWQDILIVPVPLHKKRKKWRGFNQSELLAREINNYYGWPLSLDLIKIKSTTAQAELSEDQRLHNLKAVFKWIGEPITQNILLIDDVITSGATINEAELVLRAAGASRIIKVALAKG
jgi:Predicted amidophosphoribosyltransferases